MRNELYPYESQNFSVETKILYVGMENIGLTSIQVKHCGRENEQVIILFASLLPFLLFLLDSFQLIYFQLHSQNTKEQFSPGFIYLLL